MLYTFFNKNFKNFRGTLFVEYAVILAFVVVVSAAFISDSSLQNSIQNAFDKVILAFDPNANKDDLKVAKDFLAEFDKKTGYGYSTNLTLTIENFKNNTLTLKHSLSGVDSYYIIKKTSTSWEVTYPDFDEPVIIDF